MPTHKIIIAIDGYSSCGKSTLALQLADRLDYLYIDSGAMYRAIAWYFLEHRIAFRAAAVRGKALKELHLDFRRNELQHRWETVLNGQAIESEIRGMAVSNLVSEVATYKEVRDFAVARQREWGLKGGIVMDGRDIGTTVFPQAELKIFMTAAIEVRAQRRLLELRAKHPDISLEEVRQNLAMRDYTDSHREISPLQQAPDAWVLDNSHLSMEQQLELALRKVSERIQQTGR